MFDDESYYSYKICELLLAESDLKDWVCDNPVLSTYNFLSVFNILIGSLLDNDFLSPIMKSNALNYLNLVRFNDDKDVEKIDNTSKNDKILLINDLIRSINIKPGKQYLTYYRQEMYKRTGNDYYLNTPFDFDIKKSEKVLLESMQFDQMVLLSHSDVIGDIEFSNEYLIQLTSDLKYLETINCILEEYPNQFLNELFFERYKKIISIFINNRKGNYDSNVFVLFNNKVINKTKSLLR